MTRDSLALLEMKPIGDSPVICVSFFDVGMSGSKVSRQEAEAGVVILQTNAYSTFIPRHASEASLLGIRKSSSYIAICTEMSGHTLRDVASTFRIMGVKSARTNTSRAVPTNWILILQVVTVLIKKHLLVHSSKARSCFFCSDDGPEFRVF